MTCWSTTPAEAAARPSSSRTCRPRCASSYGSRAAPTAVGRSSRGTPAGGEQSRQAARVQEREPAQVEHKAGRPPALQPAQLLVERVGVFEVQLPAERYAHRVT